jgi:hypothetical protein
MNLKNLAVTANIAVGELTTIVTKSIRRNIMGKQNNPSQDPRQGQQGRPDQQSPQGRPQQPSSPRPGQGRPQN